MVNKSAYAGSILIISAWHVNKWIPKNWTILHHIYFLLIFWKAHHKYLVFFARVNHLRGITKQKDVIFFQLSYNVDLFWSIQGHAVSHKLYHPHGEGQPCPGIECVSCQPPFRISYPLLLPLSHLFTLQKYDSCKKWNNISNFSKCDTSYYMKIGRIGNRFWVSPASFLFPHSSTITNIQSVRYDKLLMNKKCLATQLSEITPCPVRFSDCIRYWYHWYSSVAYW